MIIKCCIAFDEKNQKYFMKDFDRDLTKTKSYFVMQIYYLAEAQYYRLVEKVNAEKKQPILVRLDFFSLVSGKIPSSWVLNKTNIEQVILGPEKWSNSSNWNKDFWQDYSNGNLEAIKCYNEELEIIKKTDIDFINVI